MILIGTFKAIQTTQLSQLLTLLGGIEILKLSETTNSFQHRSSEDVRPPMTGPTGRSMGRVPRITREAEELVAQLMPTEDPFFLADI